VVELGRTRADNLVVRAVGRQRRSLIKVLDQLTLLHQLVQELPLKGMPVALNCLTRGHLLPVVAVGMPNLVVPENQPVRITAVRVVTVFPSALMEPQEPLPLVVAVVVAGLTE
jgi:hypothetical protein